MHIKNKNQLAFMTQSFKIHDSYNKIYDNSMFW